MIRYETITMDTIIIHQINIFLINCFDVEFDLRNPGSTRIKTAIKKKLVLSVLRPFSTIPKTFSLLKEFFNTRVRFFIFNFSKSF